MDNYKINGQLVNISFFTIELFFKYVYAQIQSGVYDINTIRLSRREVLDAQPTIWVYVDITQSFNIWLTQKSN